jgi:Fe-S cluster assembly protein SufD
MDLQEKLVASYMAQTSANAEPDGLAKIRSAAIETFEQQGFPTKKMEEWKYTPLNKLVKTNYTVFPKKTKNLTLDDVQPYILHDVDTYKIVFVDGVYSAFLSETTHEGMDVCLMSAALSQPKYRKVIETYFDTATDSEDSFTALNTAFGREGAFIHIPKKKVVEKPIQIIHFSTGVNQNLMLQPRNLIVADQQAEVQIIERHQSLSDTEVFTNVVTEIFTHKGAQVDYYKIQNDHEEASLVDSTYIVQQKHSHAKVHTFSFGSRFVRNNLHFYHKDEAIQSTMKGITLVEGKQLVDHHTLVHHAHPNSESHQEYKGIYDGQATGVFNGKIVVEQEAQKTNAFQQNNNILMSDKATINTKPQLEIFADDVRCTHGCTIGQLDETALFYLQTRGIPQKEARALLTYAFANNVLASVTIPAVKMRINALIAKKLGVNLGFNL